MEPLRFCLTEPSRSSANCGSRCGARDPPLTPSLHIAAQVVLGTSLQIGRLGLESLWTHLAHKLAHVVGAQHVESELFLPSTGRLHRHHKPPVTCAVMTSPLVGACSRPSSPRAPPVNLGPIPAPPSIHVLTFDLQIVSPSNPSQSSPDSACASPLPPYSLLEASPPPAMELPAALPPASTLTIPPPDAPRPATLPPAITALPLTTPPLTEPDHMHSYCIHTFRHPLPVRRTVAV